MVKKIVLLTMLLITGVMLLAQSLEEIYAARPLNSISLNLFGDASLISLYYERQLILSPSFFLSGKLGLGYHQEIRICIFGCSDFRSEKFLTIPHHITGNIGKGFHFFEFGMGGTIMCGNKNQPNFIYPIVGYRYMPLVSKYYNFRMFVQMPFSGIETEYILFIPFGMAFGCSF